MNNHPHVSEKTKIIVNAAMKELGYRPNSVARSLASKRSDCIGILVSELHGPFYGDMLSGIESELRTAGKHAIITAGHSDEATEKAGIDFLIDRNCDAIILLVDALSDDYLIKLSKGSTPIVVINRHITEIDKNCFYLDNFLGGYLATKHILEYGHKEIAYISGPLMKQDTTDRLNGHKKALTEFGIEFNEELFYVGTYLIESGKEGVNHLLKKQLPFTAIICANDEMASGAMKNIRDNDMAIPDDCSIIGFDNSFFTEYLHPQLTTVNYPIKDMAKMSALWILKNIYNNNKLIIKNEFTPTLVSRESIRSI